MTTQAGAALLQRQMNVALDRQPPLRTDGDLGPRSQAAIRVVVIHSMAPPKETTTSGFHVGLLAEQRAEGVVLRGGNQCDRVSEVPFAATRRQVHTAGWPG